MEGTSNTDMPLSCDDGDNISVNEGCESPFSSWDSEPEADIQSLIGSDDMPEEPLEGNNFEENNYLDDDGLLWEMDNRSYEDLLKKYLEKEEELRVSNSKLQRFEEEIIRLNVQVENGEAQLDNVREELKLKEEELNKEKELLKEEIIKLNVQVENGEAQLDNVREELKLKDEELNKQKELFEEEINELKIQIEKSENWHENVKEEFNLKVEKLKKQIGENWSDLQIWLKSAKSENKLDNVQEELKLNMEKLHKQIAEKSTRLQNWWNNLKSENQFDNVQKDLNLKVEKLKTKLQKIGQDYKFGKTTSGSS